MCVLYESRRVPRHSLEHASCRGSASKPSPRGPASTLPFGPTRLKCARASLDAVSSPHGRSRAASASAAFPMRSSSGRRSERPLRTRNPRTTLETHEQSRVSFRTQRRTAGPSPSARTEALLD
eukprot:6713701-Prymnesium_polylepis.1